MVEVCVVSVAGGLGDWDKQQRTLILTALTLSHEGLLPSIVATVLRQAWNPGEDTSAATGGIGKLWDAP